MRQTTQAYNTFRKVDEEWAVHAPGSGQGDTVTVSKRDGTTKSITLGKMVANDTFAIDSSGGTASKSTSGGRDATEPQKRAIRKMCAYMMQYVGQFDSFNVNPRALGQKFLNDLDNGLTVGQASEMIDTISGYLDDEM